MPQSFPELRIRRDTVVAEGPFAQAQAAYLQPDPSAVQSLDRLLRAQNAGVVAHFYMDPQLQGVLSACSWPHIHISDSLLMADNAVKMAEAGLDAVLVLGVDFMSENVRAVLDAAGHDALPVFRLASEPIGCSLAESAEQPAYQRFLGEAQRTPRALHVVYINTALSTKAQAQAMVPTITCTSSNVVKTLLQAAHQIPDVELFYGPDTYMGRNLEALLKSLVKLGTDAIKSLHPNHNAESVRSLLDRYHHFREGVCLVHHMFGYEVAAQIRETMPAAHVTAHLEVPGPMFKLGLERSQQGRGVVGSTSDILRFIRERTAAASSDAPLQFVLGTEAGMITSIVREVRAAMNAGSPATEVGIVFPVASEAVSQIEDPELALVPGIQGGEGCSIEGGCATCPYMKMNSLDALFAVLEGLETKSPLESFWAKRPQDSGDDGSLIELGTKPIFAMRHFQQHGELSDELVQAVLASIPAQTAKG